MYIGYFHHCCDLTESKVREEGVILAHVLWVWSTSQQGEPRSLSVRLPAHILAERNSCALLAFSFFPFSAQDPSPWDGAIPIQGMLPSSVESLWKYLYRHTQRCVFQMILTRLRVRINHHKSIPC